MEGKNELFHKLKPPCVALGQAAIALNGTRGNVQTATQHLESIKKVLSLASSSETNALDARLAEYVFFPVAQLLRVSQKLSIRSLELSLQCIAILIDQGWRQNIPPKLAGQIAILCSLLGEREPKGLSFSESTDDLQASSFWCLYHVFTVVTEDSGTKTALTSETQFPQLGQTISVILDGIQDGGPFEVQIAATSALDALVVNVIDREVQASFLPGIVSKLTKVLTPHTKSRKYPRVLIGCLAVLSRLLRNTSGDDQSNEESKWVDGHVARSTKHVGNSIIDARWRESAAMQLKPALANILRLKTHSRDDVKDSVTQVCLTLLQYCRTTLANCSRMAMEVLVTIAAARHEDDSADGLRTLVLANVSITTLLQDVLYDWLQSLTTILQGSDEQAKVSRLEQIRTAYGLISESGGDMSTIDRMMASTLRDGLVVTLAVSNAKHNVASFISPIQSMDLQVLDQEGKSKQFASPLVRYRGQEETMTGIERLVKLVRPSSSSSGFVAELARYLRQSHGEAQTANFWLLLTATQAGLQQKANLDDFLSLGDEAPLVYNQCLEDLYSFSLSVLTSQTDEPPDPRLQALALRGLALRAETAGQDFRYELVDALYPVLHTLATPIDELQRDSITTLNIFTSACGYASVKSLIVENVDYLTNAVALKLNAFDVSPQAPQVLLMMVRLAGPSLLPYLEDTVESIFAALEDYHGYPLLVELLFRVLSVMAEEGVKAPKLAITAPRVDGGDVLGLERWVPTSVDSLASLLRQRAEDEAHLQNIDREDPEPHLEKPWGVPKDPAESDDDRSVQENEHNDQQVDEADPSPPAPKTYNLLFKITELTQHFLPSASPSLRTSLLSLIRTTVPAIAQHENSFLPLINTLWPEIISRLNDDEPYVVTSAVDIVGLLCEYAGDFMRSRITQLWPRLLEIYQNVTKDATLSRLSAVGSSSASLVNPAAFIPTQQTQHVSSLTQTTSTNNGNISARLLWQSLLSTITTIVQHIHISPEMFDEALEIALPIFEQANIRAAFERENADAVWLASIKRGVIAKPGMPWVPNGAIWRSPEVPG